jgi:hypothetical protein
MKRNLTNLFRISAFLIVAVIVMSCGERNRLPNNYFKVGHKKETLVKKYLCEYILKNPKKFITNDAAVYIRDNGVKISYEKISKILKNELLPANLIKIRPMNHGYELIGSETDLKGYLTPNIDAYIGGWLRYNSEIFETLTNINNWIAAMIDDSKKLF